MPRRTDNVGRNLRVRIHLRWVERAETEAYSQNPSEGSVYVGGLQEAAFYSERDIRLILCIVRVTPGFDGLRSRLHRIFGYMVCCHQQIDSAQIVGYETIELPLTAQDVCQKVLIDRIR